MQTSKFPTIVAGIILALGIASGRVLAHSEGHGHEKFAAGEPGDPSKPARTVVVTMKETDGKMIFEPDSLTFKTGEQVKFEVRNTGQATHEFMLDSIEHNTKHKAAMEKNPEMEHDDPNGKTLDAGKSTEILWHFSKPGTFEFACLIPGHYEAGMHGTVKVK